MKKYNFIAVLIFCLLSKIGFSQIKTNFNNDKLIQENGFFNIKYLSQVDYIIPQININALLEKEKIELSKSNEGKPFKLAEAQSINLDIVKFANWKIENDFSYCKYTIKVTGALTTSINFDKFYLPKTSEMYIYNKDGKMITGAVTEEENNPSKKWGSWIYEGELITIEVKTPTQTFNDLQLHLNKVAYGYKEIYKSVKVTGFGLSGTCNINVLCPLGNGWDAERNSVGLLLDANGETLCSGALIMNTCNTDKPFFLTANHCYQTSPQQDVTKWRFTFQAFSATCSPNQNSSGVVTYNGSTLKANWASSDFCLVELNNTPAINLGINYAGWNRNNSAAVNATGIHHPKGDVMKISRANNPVSVGSFGGTTNQHWKAIWNQGVTEGGSSGSPLFDQNHKIVGQLHGGPSVCGGTQLWDFYGRFDLSWSGGGTNSTRLSNWLDPINTGAFSTNTSNRNSLTPQLPDNGYLFISGSTDICGASIYTLNGALPSSTITWSLSNPAFGTIIPNGNQVTVTPSGTNQNSDLIASVSVNCNQLKIVKFLLRPFNDIKLTPEFITTCYDDYYNLEYPRLIEVQFCPSNGIVTWDVPSEFNGDYTIVGNRLELLSGPTYEITQNNPLWISASVYNPTTGNTATTHINFWTQSCYGGGYYKTNNQILISPNPSNGQFKINLNSINKELGIKAIIVKNKMGIPVYSQKYNTNLKSQSVNLYNQPSDIYLVEIFDGKTWHTQKHILQH